MRGPACYDKTPMPTYPVFDIEEHKAYRRQLNVIIYPNGCVDYAIPDAVSYLRKLAARYQRCSELELMENYSGYDPFCLLQWLSMLTGCVAMNECYCIYNKINHQQFSTIRQLYDEGLYRGKLPQISEIEDLVL